jgi:hypothetical protein
MFVKDDEEHSNLATAIDDGLCPDALPCSEPVLAIASPARHRHPNSAHVPILAHHRLAEPAVQRQHASVRPRGAISSRWEILTTETQRHGEDVEGETCPRKLG